jgi:hypothetical protein
MAATLGILVLATVAGLGLWLGKLYLEGRRQPLVHGAHILLGLASFEVLIVLIQGVDDAAGGATRLGGQTTLGLIGLALGVALAAPLISRESRQRRHLMVAAHAGTGAVAILLGIMWMAGL